MRRGVPPRGGSALKALDTAHGVPEDDERVRLAGLRSASEPRGITSPMVGLHRWGSEKSAMIAPRRTMIVPAV